MKSIIHNQFLQLFNQCSRVKKLVPFALAFGLIKLNSVAAVFIFSNNCSTIDQYGMVDYALALGLMACVPLNAGLPGAFPYFILKLKKVGYEGAFFFHGLLLSAIYFSGILTVYLLGLHFTITVHLTLLIGMIFSLQVLAAVMLKCKEKVFPALLFEGGFFILLNLYNIYSITFNTEANLQELQVLWMIYLLVLSGYYAYQFLATATFKWLDYFKVLQFGFPLIISALLVVGLTGSARILIERWIDLKAVGIYGLYFRLSAIIILVHQIVNIVFFKKLYTIHPTHLDSWFHKFLLFIAVICLIASLLIPSLILPYIKIIQATWAGHQHLYVLLNFQMLFWIILALFENIIFREQLSASCNPGYLLLLTGMLITISGIYYSGYLNLANLVASNILALYLAVEWQLFLLNKKELKFPKTKRLLRLFISLLIIYFFTQIIL